jgi:hypothetical protein
MVLEGQAFASVQSQLVASGGAFNVVIKFVDSGSGTCVWIFCCWRWSRLPPLGELCSSPTCCFACLSTTETRSGISSNPMQHARGVARINSLIAVAALAILQITSRFSSDAVYAFVHKLQGFILPGLVLCIFAVKWRCCGLFGMLRRRCCCGCCPLYRKRAPADLLDGLDDLLLVGDQETSGGRNGHQQEPPTRWAVVSAVLRYAPCCCFEVVL